MVDRTANRLHAILSVLLGACILLGTAASLLGFVSLGILGVSALRPDIIPADVARRRSKTLLLVAAALALLELVVTAILRSKGLI